VRQMPAIGRTAQVCVQAGLAFGVTVQTSATLNPNFRRVDVRVRDAADTPILEISTLVARY
jgi:general secretion pathway protein I